MPSIFRNIRRWLAAIVRRGAWVLLPAVLAACGPSSSGPGRGSTAGEDAQVRSLGSVEVTARLVEVPEGAIFQRDLYDYATILKYEVVAVHRGAVEKGAVIYVGHYNPWRPRSEAADRRVEKIGGTVRRFRPGALHRMALEPSMDDHFMGGIVDKYFGQRTGAAYWALWTNAAE